MTARKLRVDVSFSALRELAELARTTEAAATDYARRPAERFREHEYRELSATAQDAARELGQFVTCDVVLAMLNAIDHLDPPKRCEYWTGSRRCTNPRRLHPGDHTFDRNLVRTVKA